MFGRRTERLRPGFFGTQTQRARAPCPVELPPRTLYNPRRRDEISQSSESICAHPTDPLRRSDRRRRRNRKGGGNHPSLCSNLSLGSATPGGPDQLLPGKTVRKLDSPFVRAPRDGLSLLRLSSAGEEAQGRIT